MSTGVTLARRKLGCTPPHNAAKSRACMSMSAHTIRATCGLYTSSASCCEYHQRQFGMASSCLSRMQVRRRSDHTPCLAMPWTHGALTSGRTSLSACLSGTSTRLKMATRMHHIGVGCASYNPAERVALSVNQRYRNVRPEGHKHSKQCTN